MTRHLSDWITSYLEYTAETMPPAIFSRWTAICCLSAALQRKVYARSGLGAEFHPNFFSFLVGEPGTGKSTAIKIGERLVRAAGIHLEVDSSTTAFLQHAFKEAYDNSAVELGADKAHASLVIFADELETFLKNERYDSELIKLLTKGYNCPDVLRHGTLKDGRLEVPNAFMTILGGIQPDNLNKQIPPETVGSGFASRVTFIYHPPQFVKYNWDVHESKGPHVLEQKLIDDLAHIATLQGQYAVTSGFKEMWDELGTESGNQEICPLGKQLISYWRRRITHLTKLSIVYAASRTDKLTLTKEDLTRALRTLTEAEEHMPYVIGSLTTSQEDLVRRDVLRALQKHGKQTFEKLYGFYKDDFSALEMKDKILRDLKLGGQIRERREGTIVYFEAVEKDEG